MNVLVNSGGVKLGANFCHCGSSISSRSPNLSFSLLRWLGRTDKMGKTALAFADEAKHPAIVDLLKKHGAK